MKPSLTRCFRGFASVPGRWNIEVFYTMPDIYFAKLCTCVQCGESYVIDFENPRIAGKTVQQIAGDALCPRCGSPLRDTIQPYPETFRTEDGRLGSFDPGRTIPPDSESLVKEFLELRP
jgi:hypothetical protein